tara:strand:+ start:5143 stop:5808 length:666 start_codon:yes stop_codon:yes gene_type:complete
MSTLKTHNLQSPDAGSVNIALTANAGMIVTGISTFNDRINIGSLGVTTNFTVAGISTFGSSGQAVINDNGNITATAITISDGQPGLFFVDTNANPDFVIQNRDGSFAIRDTTSNANRFFVNVANGDVTVTGNIVGDNSTNISGIASVTATSFHGSGANLTNLPPSAPVGGASTNQVFFENDKIVEVGYQITSTKNAMSAGPISVSAGIAVTVPSGCSWTIV